MREGGEKAQPIIGSSFVRQKTDLKLHQITDVESTKFGADIATDFIVRRVDEVNPSSAKEKVLLIVSIAHEDGLIHTVWESSSGPALQKLFARVLESGAMNVVLDAVVGSG